MTAARHTLTVAETAAALGCAPWTLYAAIRRGDSPVPFLRLGRKLVCPVAAVAQLLGIEPDTLAGEVTPGTAEVAR